MNKYQEAFKSISDNKYQYGTDEEWELLQELVDKATPKKPILSDDWKDEEQTDIYDENGFINPLISICPNCKKYGIYDFEYGEKFDYCKSCGQAIDWSDEKMTAKEMFEELGFKQVLCINLNQKDGKQVIYESVIGDNDTLLVKRKIHFFDDVFYASLHYYNDETETFENQGGCSINNDLLKAINKQCEELGLFESDGEKALENLRILERKDNFKKWGGQVAPQINCDIVEQLIKEYFELLEVLKDCGWGELTLKDLKTVIKASQYNAKKLNKSRNVQPYKFEELKKGMWVWDDGEKCCFKCNPAISTDMAQCVTYNAFWYNCGEDEDEFFEEYDEFEEGRFFPVTKALEYQGKEDEND